MGCVQSYGRKSEVEHIQITPHLAQQICQYNQNQLMLHLTEFSQSQQQNYIKQLNSIDYSLIDKLHKELVVPFLKKESVLDKKDSIDVINQKLTLKELENQKQDLEDQGLKAIVQGHVSVILMAGGQGTRLNSKDPKGLLDPELPSTKTLFQIYTERLITLQKLAYSKYPDIAKKGSSKDHLELIHFYIMTSEATDQKTKNFFQQANYFGYPKNCIHYFQQGSMPAIDKDGKVIVKCKDEVFMAPNGNGGLYQALNEGSLQEMKSLGVKYIHILGVDNILNKLADPILAGYMVKTNNQIISKYVQKANAKESVGAQIMRNGFPSVIEYSELTEEQKVETLEDGSLKFNEAFLATFMISLEFLEEAIKRQAEWAIYHLAHKKIEYFDEKEQKSVSPSDPNGFKFELFIFDCFKICTKFGLLEVSRKDEFAPIKNAVETSTTDNLNTAKQLLVTLHQKWLTDAGYRFEEPASHEQNKLCEVDPLVSYYGEGLKDYPPNYKDENEKSKLPFYLGKPKQ